MLNLKTLAVAAATGIIATTTVGVVTPAGAHTTGIHDNCTQLNKKWPHGVGKKGAVDRGPKPKDRVTNFARNTKAYKAAENHNGTLDRDNDGIACEKR